MKRFSLRSLAIASIAALAACSGGGTGGSLLPSQPQSVAESSYTALTQTDLAVLQAPRFRACDEHPAPGYATCLAILSRLAITDLPDGSSCLHKPGCYGPSDLQAAYNITSEAKTGGKGMTVAIVDAYGYPTAASDLAGYRKFFKLPACGDGCLKIVNQKGETKPLPPTNTGWDGEQSLDLDMVSAICPNCHILLVQASSQSDADLQTAVALATKHADAVSNSYGGDENYKTNPPYDNHPGAVVTASAGDDGAGALQPCSLAGVVCVGGTSLTLKNGKRVSEVVWDGLTTHLCSGGSPCGTGSGCSTLVPKPAWQSGASVAGCTMRNESDVSANADPYTGVVVAEGGRLYTGSGGTSESSPIIAAMYALAGNTKTATPATLWAKGGTSAFNDIVKGTNEKSGITFVCPSSYSYICNARKGYDGPTGWGTPNGLSAL